MSQLILASVHRVIPYIFSIFFPFIQDDRLGFLTVEVKDLENFLSFSIGLDFAIAFDKDVFYLSR